VIVTATGLQLLALGGLSISVDGRQLELSEQMTYKGLMLSGVPNLALAIGYTHASWTLKCDISFDYVCRLLDHMRERGYAYCVPELTDESITPQPLLDLASGYIQRSVDQFPRQGSRKPWRLYQNYVLDSVTLKLGDLDDGVMRFARPGSASTPKPEPEPEPEPAAAPVPSSSVAA
jgi:hypothetical protein